MSPPERGPRRVYRLLLRAFPRRFRERRGAEMETLFADLVRRRRAAGRGLGPGFWLPLAWDTLSHGVRERLRPSTGRSPLHALATDLRHAVTGLRRRPGWALGIVVIVALGIAGNAAVFRVVNGLFLKPLPFPGAERLVDLDVRAPAWDLEQVGLADPDVAAWQAGNSTFEAIGQYDVGGANLAGEGDPVFIPVLRGNHALDDVLGLEPLVGRFPSAEEDVPDGPRVALLSPGLWERAYGGDPAVVGRTVELDGEAFEVIGILPREAGFLEEADVWIPLQADPSRGGSFYASGIGRLAPGVDPAAAEADLTAIHKARIDDRPVNEATFPVVMPLRDRYLGEARFGAGVLLGAMGLVLLVACANIAGLMLARALERQREVGIRLATGAEPRRVIRQLLLESLLLAGVGGAVGTALGVLGSGWVLEGFAEAFPAWVTFDLDARFVLFTVGASTLAAALFGLLPALRTSRVDPGRALRAGSTRSTASTGQRRVMGGLVLGEVTLATVLLVLAGLALQDVHRLSRADPGYRVEGVLTYRLILPEARYPDDGARAAFIRDHVRRVEALPGVEGAGATTVLPLTGHSGWFFDVEDGPPRAEDEPDPVVLVRAVTPGFLEANRVPLVAGRTFRAGEDGRDEGTWVAVVNERFVRLFLGHREDPLGARIRAGNGPWMTVVGVNRDGRHYGVDQRMRPAVYQPLGQLVRPAVHVTLGTSGAPYALLEPARRAVAEADPGLAVSDVATMAERMDDSLFARRANAWLVATFSGVALALSVAGLYGLIAYTVGRRRRDMGIRMALGARRTGVVGGILGRGMALVAFGVAAGLALAFAAAPSVAGLLAGEGGARAPGVYAVVALLLLTVAALAHVVPARRAARLDPAGVLREE